MVLTIGKKIEWTILESGLMENAEKKNVEQKIMKVVFLFDQYRYTDPPSH